jgi:hypothetical protein
MTDASNGWPIDVSPESTLRTTIRNCGIPAGKARVGVLPRWAVVSRLTTHGSTYSAMLCRWAGLDPDEMVRPRR